MPSRLHVLSAQSDDMELVAVTADATLRPQSDRYREIADEIRTLVPKMKFAEVAEQLRLLAISYERLAEHAEDSTSLLDPSEDSGDLPGG